MKPYLLAILALLLLACSTAGAIGSVPLSPAPMLTPTRLVTSTSHTVLTVTGNLNLRRVPLGTDGANVLAVMPEGAQVTFIRCGDVSGWVYIQFGDLQGWANEGWLDRKVCK